MKVTCIRAGVKDLPSGALIAKAMHVEACMHANANFPSPSPTIATITAAREALAIAVANATNRARADVAIRWERHSELERLLVQLSKYILSAAPGDIATQLTSGFELRTPPVRIAVLTAPPYCSAVGTNAEGALLLKWGAVHGARTYQVFVNDVAPENDAAWRMADSCTRRRTPLRNLTPGAMHWFRTRAVGAAGIGPWSSVVAMRVC